MKVEPEAPHDGQGMRGGGRELVLGRQAGRRAGERDCWVGWRGGGRALATCMPTSTLNMRVGVRCSGRDEGAPRLGARWQRGEWQAATASVKEATAALGATVAGQLVAGILNGELVVIGELLTTQDRKAVRDRLALQGGTGDFVKVFCHLFY